MDKPYIDLLPYFSWKLESEDRGEIQTEYKIVVETKNGECFWDTGYVKSDSTVGIKYEGKTLLPETEYLVTVFSKGKIDDGEKCEKSSFKTGKMFNPWKGRWITSWYYNVNKDVDSPVLRKEFILSKEIEDAELYICGLGYFEAKINGEKVGDDFLSIPFTRYDKHTEYRIYNVKNLLKDKNAITVYLGNGFYNCFTDDPWQTAVAEWREVPKLLCDLKITYKDGTTDTISSDTSWQTGHSPITFNGIRHGESYDANLEEDGIEEFGFISHRPENWKNARQVRAPGGVLMVSDQEPVRVRDKFTPVSKIVSEDGKQCFKFIRDIAGVCNINFKGKKGEKIVVRYSDIITEDGKIADQGNSFIKNYYFQTEEYTKKSDLPEKYYTKFTYYGFQVIEVTGGDNLELDDIEAWAFCNDFEDRGYFKCDDDIVNTIQDMTLASTESCCVGTLSADTVREKSSWTGDTGLTTEQILINYASEAFMNRWMRDFREAQRVCGTFPCIIPSTGWGYNRLNGPDWSQPSVEVPLRLYNSTGDKKFLEENFDELKRHVNNMRDSANDYIAVFGLGDWCPPFTGPAISINMSSYKCPVRLTDTGYFYDAVTNLCSWAKILGYEDEYKEYSALAEKIKEKFNEKFYGSQKVENTDCQTALGTVIYRKLYKDENDKQEKLKALLKSIDENEGKLDFGVLGMKAVSNAMGENGYAAKCLEMLRGPEFPSYGHWIELGATTLYECWNGLGSHNHHMFSDVSEFFYKYLAGIQIDTSNPGYKSIIFKPCLDSRIKNISAMVDTIKGKVSVEFKVSNDNAIVKVSVPVGSKAKYYIDKNYTLQGFDSSEEFIELESGKYELKLMKKQV